MKQKTRDNLIYLAIALALVGGVLLTVSYEEAHGLPIRIPFSDQLFLLVATTAVVFGFIISAWRKAWRQARFWVALSVMLIAYLPIQWQVTVYLRRQFLVVGLITIAQMFLLSVLMDKIAPRRQSS